MDADRRAIIGPIVGFHDPVRTPGAMLDFFGTTKYALTYIYFILEDQTYGKWTYLHYCSYGVIRL